ncbi:HIP-like protein [Mya arenaria]|uniref:HIP-like protein n=2 Tax=Mya arenaria TaxID=6604 RepID=A0ABY7F3H7_MYAAR|nr:HIP-like protein [Mya arenaria]
MEKRLSEVEDREIALTQQLLTQTAEIDALRATVARQEARIALLESTDYESNYKHATEPDVSDTDEVGQQELKHLESDWSDHKDIAEISTRILSQKRFVLSPPEIPVAFSAFLSIDLLNVSANQAIIFDNVLTNEGNGYHSHHGLFVAPQSGLYVFTVTIKHPTQSLPSHVDVVHDSKVIARLHCESNQYEQSSHSFIVNVKFGEEVYVINRNYNSEHFAGYMSSSFSGFLIWQS